MQELGDVGSMDGSVNEAERRADDYESRIHLNVEDCIDKKVRFCADNIKYRVDIRVNEDTPKAEIQEVNNTNVTVTNEWRCQK